MRKQKQAKRFYLLVIIVTVMVMGWSTNENWAAEKDYPNRLIQYIIPYNPGSTDISHRPFTDKLPEFLGQPVAFVYKPGANGTIGASFVAKAKPDGYTLLGGPASPIFPVTKMDFTHEDLFPICRIATTPIVIVVKADSPWKTLKDLLEEAKKSPGKLTYATSGVFSVNHIAMERVLKRAGTEMTHVPSAGIGPAISAILGGHVSALSATMASVTGFIRAGSLRLLATYEPKRVKEFPDASTVTELGYPVVSYVWHGLFAPKNTPREVTMKIYTAFQKVNEKYRDTLIEQLAKVSLTLDLVGHEEFAKDIKEEYESRKIIIADMERAGPKK